jgi:hypothetical protein
MAAVLTARSETGDAVTGTRIRSYSRRAFRLRLPALSHTASTAAREPLVVAFAEDGSAAAAGCAGTFPG